jgi:ABC-type sugar transport system substrate-binding protein
MKNLMNKRGGKTMKRTFLFIAISAIIITNFTACNPKSKAQPGTTSSGSIKIGMAAFMMGQEWYQNIVAGAENRARELGVEFIVADGNNDSSIQVTAIENFIAQKVNAIVISPVDANALITVVKQAKANGIKVICESNMVEGADTRVGISDFESGKTTGLWFAKYAKANGIKPKLLILGYKALENCRNRVEGFKAGMTEGGLEYTVAIEVDGGFREASMNATIDALTAHPDINAVFGINDDSTLGAISAIKQVGLNLENFTTILYGLEGVAGRTSLNDGSAAAGLSMFPEYVGTTCVNAAMDAINGKPLPDMYVSPTIVVEKKDFNTYFTDVGGVFKLNFAAVDRLVNQ